MTWSPYEVEAKIPVLVDRIEDGIADLKRLGESAAQSKWVFEYAEAVALIQSSGMVEGRSSKEQREAYARMYEFTAADMEGRAPQWIGSTLIDVGMTKELAANAYDDARRVLYAIQAELDVARTLLVSARQVQDAR